MALLQKELETHNNVRLTTLPRYITRSESRKDSSVLVCVTSEALANQLQRKDS